MTLHRISHSVSTARTPVFTAILGAVLGAAAVVAVLAMAGNTGSPSTAESPTLTRIEVPSMPGVRPLTDGELVASAFAEHESYMEAHFGPYVRPAWVPRVDIESAKNEHDRLIDAVLRP